MKKKTPSTSRKTTRERIAEKELERIKNDSGKAHLLIVDKKANDK